MVGFVALLGCAKAQADSKPDEIVAADLLTVKEPKVGSRVTVAGHPLDDAERRYRLWGLF